MTKEDAIKMLESKMDGNTDTSYEWAETVRMAIKALEQQSSEDCVSRQAVKEGMIKYGFHAPDMTVTEFVEDELPPVTPTQRWIPVSEILPKKTGWYFVTFPISDNATNGDVMLAIFKEIQHYSDGKICADWWNAPYKRGNENG